MQHSTSDHRRCPCRLADLPDGEEDTGGLTDDARRRVRREAGGDLAVARELARALARTADPGAELLRRFLPLTPTLLARAGRLLDGLPAATRLVLAVAAEHRGDDVAGVLEAAGLVLGEALGVDVLRPAADAGLVDLTAARVRFDDPVLRTAATLALGYAAHRDVHDALSVVADRPASVAWHRAHVVEGPDETVAAALEAAASGAGPRTDAVEVLRLQELAARLSPDPDARARRWAAAARTCAEIGRADVGEDLLGRAEAAAARDPEVADAVAALRGRSDHAAEGLDPGRAAWRAGLTGEASVHLAAAASGFRASGRRALLAQAQALRAQVLVALGDWDVAVSAADEAIALAAKVGDTGAGARAHGVRALVGAYRGDAAGALADRRAMTSLGGADLLALDRLARGVAALQGARWDDAVDDLQAVVDPPGLRCGVEVVALALTHLAEAAVRAGRRGAVAEALAGLGDGALPPALTTARAYALALVADDGVAHDALAAALAATPPPWSFLRARTGFALGVWLRRHHRPRDGRRALADAAAAFDLAGACWWTDAVHAELRVEPVGVDGGRLGEVLSAQELRIAALVAEGLSNREIGRRLLLSPRTIGCYLYRMFPKLGISSRVQLATRIRTLGAEPAGRT
ncbi:LuxR C-terminal-related transcriptional regulator [Actinomycetospora sp. CA-101289]|uniref:LuxR C-terminal-related transcriptional regulator n=1 Tax=Actinomycetospora sp. CA-101289 TaxID=3239893 RepID=UPI003D97145C